MIINAIYPTNEKDLVRVFQRMMTEDVRIHEPYSPQKIDAIKNDADEMAKEPGSVTVILVRS